MQPSRMPTYSVSNDGMGPYAVFSCERCGREYRSAPSVVKTVQQSVTRGALGGFLRNIPIVGSAAANQVEDDQDRTSMTQEELAEAWGQVGSSFRECPTCRQVVCLSDYDAQADTCTDDSPRAAEIEAAKAAQAAATLKGVADAFGLGNALTQGLAQAQAAAATGATGTGQSCPTCGTPAAAGARFCASCGTPVPQATSCRQCGSELSRGARFCASCGTAVA
jgi:hypothetical protein